MYFERKTAYDPAESASFIGERMTQVGTVKTVDVTRFDHVCESITPPEAQLKLNNKKLDPSKPLRTCREWVDEVVESLTENGILVAPASSPSESKT